MTTKFDVLHYTVINMKQKSKHR